MKEIISTEYSTLYTGSLKDMSDLVDSCVDDIRPLLNDYPEIIVYGKKCLQRRSVGFFSDSIIGYKYSGKIETSQRLTKNLKILLDHINIKFNSDFNGILVNKYKDGLEYISDHSDNEQEISDKGVISISYGATRKFRIRNKLTKKIVKDILTENYQIIQMNGNFQKEFLHGIPIEKKIKEERISFTFRKHLV
jgi:alkylated DNA repair dioxygenase AlkB